jgi:hypothetical protein
MEIDVPSNYPQPLTKMEILVNKKILQQNAMPIFAWNELSSNVSTYIVFEFLL